MKILEFKKEIAEKCGLTSAQVTDVLASFAEVLIKVVEVDEKLNIPGFGTFKLSKRAARKGINPKTKEPIDIAASKSIGFKLSKPNKEKLNS